MSTSSQALYSKLVSIAGVSSRVYPFSADADTTYPCVVYTPENVEYYPVMGGYTDVHKATYTVACIDLASAPTVDIETVKANILSGLIGWTTSEIQTVTRESAHQFRVSGDNYDLIVCEITINIFSLVV